MTMLSNPGPHSIKLTLSNGSVRYVGPWGLAILPDSGARGMRLEITSAELVQTQSTPNSGVDPAIPPAPDTQRAA